MFGIAADFDIRNTEILYRFGRSRLLMMMMIDFWSDVDDIALITTSIKGKRQKQSHITPQSIFFYYEKKVQNLIKTKETATQSLH